MKQTNERGMTLIELLVVITILGIISTIAVIGFSTIMQKSKDNAFLANAYSLKAAAEKYYYSSGLISEEIFAQEISYNELITNGFLEPFHDPDNNEMMPEDGNNTFIHIEKVANGTVTYSICYIGNVREICDGSNGISFDQLGLDKIENRD